MDGLDEALAPWYRRADRLIVDRMADARSHASVGRLAVATQRLADLHHSLAGPDGSGVIGDAKGAFFRDAFRLAPFDPDLHDPAWRLPSPDGVAAARTAPIYGLDTHRDAGLRIDRARAGLVLAAAGRPGSIDTWHEQHATPLRAWARRTLSDAQMVLHHQTQRLRRRGDVR